MAIDFNNSRIKNIGTPSVSTSVDNSGYKRRFSGEENLGHLEDNARGMQFESFSAIVAPVFDRAFQTMGTNFTNEMQRRDEATLLEQMTNINAGRIDLKAEQLAAKGKDGINVLTLATKFWEKHEKNQPPIILEDNKRRFSQFVNNAKLQDAEMAVIHTIAENRRYREQAAASYIDSIQKTPSRNLEELEEDLKKIGNEIVGVAPGDHNDLKIREQQKVKVYNFYVGEMQNGNRGLAKEALNKYSHLFDAPEIARMQEDIKISDIDAQVNNMVSEAINSGERLYGAADKAYERVGKGEIPVEVAEKFARALSFKDALDTRQLKEEGETNRENSNKKIIQKIADKSIVLDDIMKDPYLTAADKERYLKAIQKPEGVIKDLKKTRDVRTGLDFNIDVGKLKTRDDIMDYVNLNDPEAIYFTAEDIDKAVLRLKKNETAEKENKFDYFNNAVAETIKTNAKFFKKNPQKAEEYKRALFNAMDAKGIDKYNPELVDIAKDLMEVKKGDGWFDGPMQRGFELGMQEIKETYSFVSSRFSNSLGINDDTSGTKAKPTSAEEDIEVEHNLSPENIKTTLNANAMANTPWNVKRAKEAIKTGKNMNEILPPGGENWGGKGKVTLKLGRVNVHNNLIEKHALAQGIDPNLLAALISVESGGNANAIGIETRKWGRAKGLCQFIDATAKTMGITDPYDPEQAIKGGARYLRELIDQFDGDVEKALGAYNTGPANIRKWEKTKQLAKETQNYGVKILNIYFKSFNE